eukprot:828773_1
MFQRFTVSTIITFIAIWSSKQMNARAQCLSTIRQEFDVSSFTEWETVCPDGKETAGTFTTSTSNAYCYITKPCIKIVGTGGSVSDVYIEKTLRTSLWKEITISFEAYTRSLDTSDEFKLRIECGFIETAAMRMQQKESLSMKIQRQITRGVLLSLYSDAMHSPFALEDV